MARPRRTTLLTYPGSRHPGRTRAATSRSVPVSSRARSTAAVPTRVRRHPDLTQGRAVLPSHAARARRHVALARVFLRHDGAMPLESSEPLRGGNMGEVLRVGATVRRPAGPWTVRVQQHMRELRDQGLEFVPEPLGVDEDGREVVAFVEGDVGVYPMPHWIWSDDLLEQVGATLRRLHDVSGGLPKELTGWQRDPVPPADVVCHGDVAPYNVVCREGRLIALIDWDFAVPAPAGWDLGYAAYRWVSLTPPDHQDGRRADVVEQRRRLELFCRAYGGVRPQEVLAWAVRRLDDLVDYSLAQAARGDVRFVATTAAGHVYLYRRDAAWIRRTYGIPS